MCNLVDVLRNEYVRTVIPNDLGMRQVEVGVEWDGSLYRISEVAGGSKVLYLHYVLGGTTEIRLVNQNPVCTLFMTASLSGCCIGIKFNANEIVVYHKNYSDRKKKIFNAADYTEDVDCWLIPDTMTTDIQSVKILKYRSGVVWGEYKNATWHIYYRYNNIPDENDKTMYEITAARRV